MAEFDLCIRGDSKVPDSRFGVKQLSAAGSSDKSNGVSYNHRLAYSGSRQVLNHELILILDFGSQYTQLITRRVREQGVYCEILPFNTPVETISARKPKGIILSGGPSSVTEDDAPRVPGGFYEKVDVPILGICYGMQLLAVDLGGKSEPADRREYGHAKLKV